MTTIKELQEWLKRFPEETIIEVGILDNGNIDFCSPDLKNEDYGKGWEFIDLRNNKFITSDNPEIYNKTFLRLGE